MTKIDSVFVFDKSTISNGSEWFVFTFSLAVEVKSNSSVSTSIVVFLTFWFANAFVVNSSSNTSIVTLLTFSLAFESISGSNVAEPISPIIKFGFMSKKLVPLARLIYPIHSNLFNNPIQYIRNLYQTDPITDKEEYLKQDIITIFLM